MIGLDIEETVCLLIELVYQLVNPVNAQISANLSAKVRGVISPYFPPALAYA